MSVPTTSHPVDRHSSVPSTEWEEPHPGQRLLCPVEPIAAERQDGGQDAQRFEGSGDSAVGTPITSHHRLSLTVSRASSQAATMSVISQEMSGTMRPALVSPDSASGVSGNILESPLSPLTCETLDVDVDMGNVDKMMADESYNNPRSPSFLALSPISEYEDLSHYLDDAPDSPVSPDSDILPMANVADSGSYSHATRLEDMYGWDAEWDRRKSSTQPELAPTVSNTSSDVPSSFLSRRSQRNSLLQRVLSVGKAPARISTSRRARFSP